MYDGGRSKWPFIEDNPFCICTGNWLRQIAYKQVAEIAKFVPGIDIICCGGLLLPENVVEAMMLGAKVTQFVTGMLYEGRTIMKRYVHFLSRHTEEQGYESVNDFIGLGQKYIRPVNEIDFKPGKI
jgi:dihydroorotate dehydrogenase